MPIEAVAFFLGAAGLIAFAAAIGWAAGYRAGAEALSKAIVDHEAPRGFFEQPTPAALAAQYEAWKAAEQRTRLDS